MKVSRLQVINLGNSKFHTISSGLGRHLKFALFGDHVWSVCGVSYIIIVPPVYYVSCQAALYSAYCQAPPSLTPPQLLKITRRFHNRGEGPSSG